MLAFILAIMIRVAGWSSLWLAQAIEYTIAHDCTAETSALGSCTFDAAALVITASEEALFCYGSGCPRGDHGASVTTWQLMLPTEESRQYYSTHPIDAARRAYSIMRIGSRLCDEPLAPYAGGCHSKAARAIANRRAWGATALAWQQSHQPIVDLEGHNP